jgi:uncharacterized protein YjbJ (UPF0337 family)
MSRLEAKGERNKKIGRLKQREAAETNDPFECVEGKEEELVGELQKKFGQDEEEILEAIEQADDTEE